MENMSKVKIIEELPEGTFPVTFEIIYLYQCKYPGIMENLKCKEYQTAYYCGCQNSIDLVA